MAERANTVADRPPAIEARRIFAAHPTSGGAVVALQGLSLAIRRGEFVAVLGPSGAGKSTLMNCLAGRHRPLAGELHVLGTRLHDASERQLARWRAGHIGLVGQRFGRALSGDLPVLDLVSMPAILRGTPVAVARERAFELLALSGLEDRAHTYRASLSGGQQQCVVLCAALASEPSLLLADEVTGELDEDAGRMVLDRLRTLARAQDVTVVLATHDLKATGFADRAVTVRDGRITAELSSDGPTVMVDESGLIRLDVRDLAAAGIIDRAQLELCDDHLVLRAPRPSGRPVRGQQAAVAPVRRMARDGSYRSRVKAATIAVEDVTKVYGTGAGAVRALDRVNLKIAGPGLRVLVAPSGSGKSTLLHVVAGLERPTSGDVRVAGVGLNNLSRAELAAFRREHLTIVPQGSALSAHLTVEENVGFALIARNHAASTATAVDEAVSAVGLSELTNRRAAELSGGERQRVAVARALVARPSVILADEPTSNLDETNADAVARMLEEVAMERGIAILCATHDPTVIADADEVLHLAELQGGGRDEPASESATSLEMVRARRIERRRDRKDG